MSRKNDKSVPVDAETSAVITAEENNEEIVNEGTVDEETVIPEPEVTEPEDVESEVTEEPVEEVVAEEPKVIASATPQTVEEVRIRIVPVNLRKYILVKEPSITPRGLQRQATYGALREAKGEPKTIDELAPVAVRLGLYAQGGSVPSVRYHLHHMVLEGTVKCINEKETYKFSRPVTPAEGIAPQPSQAISIDELRAQLIRLQAALNAATRTVQPNEAQQ